MTALIFTTVLFENIPARAQSSKVVESNKAIDANGNYVVSNYATKIRSDLFPEGKPISVIVDGWWSHS